VFARTLQGVTMNIELEKLITKQFETLKQFESHEELLRHLWPMITEGIENNSFQKIDKPEILLEMALLWISGESFADIFNTCKEQDVKIIWGKKSRELTVEHIVDICEMAFGYDGTLRIGAISDLLEAQESDDTEKESLTERLNELHKRFKYGLPQTSSVVLYECGFADRIVAQNLSEIIGNTSIKRPAVVMQLKEKQEAVRQVLQEYPKYFDTCLTQLIG
jgi:hypothetical protein